MKNSTVFVVSVFMFFFTSCADRIIPPEDLGPNQNLEEAKKIAKIYNAAPYAASILEKSYFGTRMKVIIKRGINDLQDSVVRKVEVFFDEIKVYEDTSSSYWFGLTVFHTKINEKDFVVVLGGREVYFGNIKRTMMVAANGEKIDLFPKEVEYTPYMYEDEYWDFSEYLPACGGFSIKRTEEKAIFRFWMGVNRHPQGFWNYWFTLNTKTGLIKQYGPDGERR